MATKTSQPAGGALLISEMKEFAGFPKSTQRYIRRSLDVAYGPWFRITARPQETSFGTAS